MLTNQPSKRTNTYLPTDTHQPSAPPPFPSRPNQPLQRPISPPHNPLLILHMYRLQTLAAHHALLCYEIRVR